MGRRAGVARASWPITSTDLMGLAGQLSTAMARVPFRRPWSGEGSLPHNLAVAVTRETLRSFMGYSSSLPIAEWRSIELVLDDLCGVVLPPLVRSVDIVQKPDTVAGVPGIWYRPRNGLARGTILYLHGGGYIGTSPRMYGLFIAWLCRRTGCDIFVADIRLAPEFPFPADLEDAVLVLESLLAGGVEASRLFVAGDSSGGGLVSSLMYSMTSTGHRPIAGAVLFSPELDLVLDEPSHHRERRPGHPALEHPDRAVPARPRPGLGLGVRRRPGRERVAAHLRLLRGRRDVPRRHPPVRRPTSRRPASTRSPPRSRACSTCSPS